MSLFTKNLEKFLIFFFTGVSVVLIVMGVARAKKPTSLAAAPAPTPTPAPQTSTLGATTITGSAYQTPWGSASASITVKGGQVVAVSMPSVPNSPPSIYAEPYLIDQALKAGSANIQGVSGATYTSIAFKSSLQSALAQATTQGQSVSPSTNTAVVTPTAKPTVPQRYRDDDDDDDDDD